MAAISLLGACGERPRDGPEAAGGGDPVFAQPDILTDEGQPELPSVEVVAADPLIWAPAPADPSSLGAAASPRLVRLSAPWCHWCRVFEHEVLPDPELVAVMRREFETLEVDVDVDPRWMDLPGVTGLPALVFFDIEGRHVLTRSGYRTAADLRVLLGAVAGGLRRNELEAYPDLPPPLPLGSAGRFDGSAAAAEITRIERAIFILVNSNDGGFGTPARDPHPGLLLELQSWGGRSERADQWIQLTSDRALRGASPRLESQPLADFSYSVEQLVEFSGTGPSLGARWRDAVDLLPDRDPYRGLQDPVDYGLFRYCAGPGWYHPHFERRAMDNLAWALLLEARGQELESRRIYGFVVETFGAGGSPPQPLATTQRSDPFYYRLRAEERVGVPPPPVAPLIRLEVQARAARLDPRRCDLLRGVAVDSWPASTWGPSGDPDRASAPATVDAVGEFLIALEGCPGQGKRAEILARLVLAEWEDVGFTVDGRLIGLAVGVCRALPSRCDRVLATVAGLEVDPRFPPPLAALSRL